jgi:enamine deaminase RidA (YjgF/YER057c/UK114 family)
MYYSTPSPSLSSSGFPLQLLLSHNTFQTASCSLAQIGTHKRNSEKRERKREMASIQYFERPGPSGKDCTAAGFSNVVVIPAHGRIAITAGQAGIDLRTGKLVESSPEAQIEACFDCLDVALKSAGVVQGLASAHKVVSFLPDQRHDPIMMEIWRRRYPGKRPTWMSVGSGVLGLKGMIIELQAEAVIVGGLLAPFPR